MLTGTNRVELYSWPTRPFQGPVSSLWGKKHGSWPPTFRQVSQALPVRPPWWPRCRAKSDGPLGSTPEMVSLGAFPPREQMSGRAWKDTVALSAGPGCMGKALMYTVTHWRPSLCSSRFYPLPPCFGPQEAHLCGPHLPASWPPGFPFGSTSVEHQKETEACGGCHSLATILWGSSSFQEALFVQSAPLRFWKSCPPLFPSDLGQ